MRSGSVPRQQVSKCTLWEEDESSHSEEAEDFVMAGKPNKTTKFLQVPKRTSTDQGFDCEGKTLRRLMDVHLKVCLKECRNDKKCVAVNRWKDWGMEDFWRCTLYNIRPATRCPSATNAAKLISARTS